MVRDERLRPYLTAEKKIDGVVLSFVDIDTIVRSKAEIENGETLCAQHNFQKKNYKQTESGKRFFIRLYEAVKKNRDKPLIDFCTQILEVYEKNGVNSHIVWER